MFVAVAILQLIEAEKLRFDSAIGELLDFDLKELDPFITVEQLLTHTSGIPDYFDEAIMGDYAELWREYPNYKIRTSSDLIPLLSEDMTNKLLSLHASDGKEYYGYGIWLDKVTDGRFTPHFEGLIRV